jgi:dihydrofolate reductase
MPSLTVDFICSLDGYGAAEGWPGWWGLESPGYLAWLESEGAQEHRILMGATTFRLMHSFVEAGEPGTEQLTAIPKVVFSSTLAHPLPWAGSQLVDGDAAAWVREEKQSGGSPMRTLGSISLCRSLLRGGVVDRFRVVLFPVITGATGTDRIFDGYPDIALELVEHRTFDGGLQMLEYVPTVLDGPPGQP